MIEVALIGFGLAGRYFHAPLIHAVPGLRLAAVLQRNGDEAAKCYPEARIVHNVKELLAIESIRLVVIASPNQTHLSIAVQCLEAGREVVVDKPITPTLPEAIELFRMAKGCGRFLTVFHSRRFDSDFQAVRQVVAGGELGQVLRFETHYDRYRPTSRANAWREVPGPGSGILFDLAPHLIDHAMMLFGPPEAVAADIRIERSGFLTDDAFDICFFYPGNLRAHLHATMLCATPRPRFVLLGEKGTFIKNEFDAFEPALRREEIPKGEAWVLDPEENWGVLTVVADGQMRKRKVASRGDWREFYANVRDALLGQAALQVTPKQVIDVMIALELAQESQARRCVIPWRNVAL
ncbi:MAG: Gfo/Idh/MocA family oxidoreductase [Candidatus Acidiferrales bacterium]